MLRGLIREWWAAVLRIFPSTLFCTPFSFAPERACVSRSSTRRPHSPVAREARERSRVPTDGTGRSSFEFENTAISVTASAAALCVHTYVYLLHPVPRTCAFFLLFYGAHRPRCRLLMLLTSVFVGRRWLRVSTSLATSRPSTTTRNPLARTLVMLRSLWIRLEWIEVGIDLCRRICNRIVMDCSGRNRVYAIVWVDGTMKLDFPFDFNSIDARNHKSVRSKLTLNFVEIFQLLFFSSY